jgi:hypothetical protein
MKRILPPTVLALILGFLCAGSASAANYYVSTSGSDANSGTSESAPWAHLPGMVGCANNCASNTPAPGNTYTLRGCDDFPNGDFPISWKWSGTSGNLITVGGLDTKWYNTASCSTWNRPIFDGGGSPLSGSSNTFVSMGGNGYVEWTWIEHKGHNWTSTNYGYQQNACLTTGGSGVIIDNWYVHGWTHTGGATSDSFQCFAGSTTPPFNSGSVLQYNVFDGTDSTNGGDSGSFMYVWPNVKYNSVNNASNGIYGPLGINGGEIGNNTVTNINQSFDHTVHENCVEILIGVGNNGTFYIHDNVLANCIGEEIMLGNTGETDYVWNNLLYGNMGNMIQLPQNGDPGNSMYFWNNTLVARSGVSCFLNGNFTWTGVIQIENNHCITSASSGSYSLLATANFSAAGGVTVSNNVVQTPATATSQGYTSSESYVYSPASSSGSTVGAGANLTSGWPAGYSANDTTYACSEANVNGVIESYCPVRTSNSRPPTGAWDSGAYLFGTPPSPPTGLVAVVH